jgi:hypothetical protein
MVLASEKDAGFSRQVLRDMLGGFDRFEQTDFALDDTSYAHLVREVRRWRATLALSSSRTTNPPDNPSLGL